MRTALLVALTLAASACSLVGDDGGLTEVWRTEAESNAPLGRQGAPPTASGSTPRRGPRSSPMTLTPGTSVWRAQISRFCSPPPVAAGRVFCPSDDITALDAETGCRLWVRTPDTTFQLVKGTADADRVYAGVFANGGTTTLYAYDAATGALEWRRRVTGPDWTGVGVRDLVLDGGTLFASAEAYHADGLFFSSSVILAYDAATGRELWRFEDGDGTDSRKIGGLDVTDDAFVYANRDGNEVVAVDRATRGVRWRVRRRPGFRGTVRAPEVVDGVAYIAEGDEHLYAIDVATGDVLWDVKPDRGSYRNHEVCGPYLVGDNTALTVVDRATGALVDVLLEGSDNRVAQMAERDGRLYVATQNAAYAFDCT